MLSRSNNFAGMFRHLELRVVTNGSVSKGNINGQTNGFLEGIADVRANFLGRGEGRSDKAPLGGSEGKNKRTDNSPKDGWPGQRTEPHIAGH